MSDHTETITCTACGATRRDEEGHTDGPREYCADCWVDLDGDLHDYATGAHLGPATTAQAQASVLAAQDDGGAGVIVIDEDGDVVPDDLDDGRCRRVYVQT